MSILKVVHLTLTPLAGAPIRIVNALNKYCDISARLINLDPLCYGNRVFPEDLVWNTDKAECLDLLSEANIIHIHHWMDLSCSGNPFGINVQSLNPKAKVIFHAHSNISFIKELFPDFDINKYETVVITHCPERDFINAVKLPNIIDENDPLLVPKELTNEKLKVFFSPSSSTPLTKARWNTKGRGHVLRELKSIQREVDFELIVVENTPYLECMKLKQECDIVIDDVITGSFHMTAIEGLSMGKAVVSFMDGRTSQITTSITKSVDLPIINVRLGDLKDVLKRLMGDRDLLREIGRYSRYWIENHYSAKANSALFEEYYRSYLSDDPRAVPEGFVEAKRFLASTVNDIIWRNYFNNAFLKARVRLTLYKLLKPLVYLIPIRAYRKQLKSKIKRNIESCINLEYF